MVALFWFQGSRNFHVLALSAITRKLILINSFNEVLVFIYTLCFCQFLSKCPWYQRHIYMLLNLKKIGLFQTSKFRNQKQVKSFAKALTYNRIFIPVGISCSVYFFPMENFSLIMRRQRFQRRIVNFDLYLTLIVTEQWKFFFWS